jgi:hypothetical protein
MNSVHNQSSATFFDSVLDALDSGPWDFDPHTAATIAIATPIALVLSCLLAMVCRGVPAPLCGGRCTYFSRRVPNGTNPDHAIEEYQDELADVDSVDEPMEEALVNDDSDEQCIYGSGRTEKAQRECCNKVAVALANDNFKNTKC